MVEEKPVRSVKIGTKINPMLRVNMIRLLRENTGVFSFSVDQMPGIYPYVIVHRVNVERNIRLLRNKKRKLYTEKIQAIQKEVKKLLAAGLIEPCDYREWLANVAMVKKSNDSWRMCVDVTDLNRAFPKYCYPLPRIDRLVDSTPVMHC